MLERGMFGIVQIALIGVLLVTGFHLQDVSLRSLLFILLPLLGLGVLLLPYHRAIQLFFLYIGIEGFAKIMTGYNPVIHVGADILVVALVAKFALKGIITRRIITRELPPLTILFVLHLIWFFIAAANPYALSLVASLAAAKMYITMPLLFFFGYYLTSSRERVDEFIQPWLVICVLQVISSLYQAALGPKSVLGLSPLYAIQLAKFKGYAFRPFGLTNQPGAPSIYLYMATPMILYVFITSRSLLLRLLLLCLMGGSSIALLFCQVRSAILKALIGLTGTFVSSFRVSLKGSPLVRRRLFGFLGLALLLVLVALPKILGQVTSGSADSKMAIERSMSLFDVNVAARAREGAMDRFRLYASMAPLGAGLSRTGAAAGKFADQIAASPFFNKGFFTDNFWLATLVDLGIPGMILLSSLVFAILGMGAFSIRRMQDSDLKIKQTTLLCSLIAIVCGFYGAESILYNPEAAFFWFFSGAMLKLPVLDREQSIAQNTAPITHQSSEETASPSVTEPALG